jgi:hypothetical protein
VSEQPWVVYPGNLQGRHARETGAKGASLVEVHDGRISTVEHRALDVVRFVACDVTAPEEAGPDDVVDLARRALEREVAAADGRTVAARIAVRGATRAHAGLVGDRERWDNELRSVASDVAGDELWLERVDFMTTLVVDRERLAAREDAIGQVVRALAALRDDPADQATLLGELAALRTRLPPEARRGPDALVLDDPAFLRTVLDDVEGLLLPALLDAGGDE